MERVPDLPLHIACEQEHEPECYKPRQGLFKAGTSRTGGGDNGVDEVLGDVDEQRGLETQEYLHGDDAQGRSPPMRPDVGEGPAQIGP